MWMAPCVCKVAMADRSAFPLSILTATTIPAGLRAGSSSVPLPSRPCKAPTSEPTYAPIPAPRQHQADPPLPRRWRHPFPNRLPHPCPHGSRRGLRLDPRFHPRLWERLRAVPEDCWQTNRHPLRQILYRATFPTAPSALSIVSNIPAIIVVMTFDPPGSGQPPVQPARMRPSRLDRFPAHLVSRPGDHLCIRPRFIERPQRFPGLVPQGVSAELVADKWGLSRAPARRVRRALARAGRGGRRRRAASTTRSRRSTADGTVVAVDESIRPGTTVEQLGSLKAAFGTDGDAPRASRRSTGRSPPATPRRSPTAPRALLVMSAETAPPRSGCARGPASIASSVVGDDPMLMLTGPIPATAQGAATAPG